MQTREYFRWAGDYLHRQKRIKLVKIKQHDIETSLLEGILTRGDRRVSPALYEAWQRGARLDGWKECFNAGAAGGRRSRDLGIDVDFYRTAQRPIDESAAVGPRQREEGPRVPGEGAGAQRDATARDGGRGQRRGRGQATDRLRRVNAVNDRTRAARRASGGPHAFSAPVFPSSCNRVTIWYSQAGGCSVSDRPTPSHLPDGEPTVDRASIGATVTPQHYTHAPDGTLRSGLETFVPAAESRYVFGDELARGGMGIVYRATDTVFGREVAVKVLQEKFGLMSAAARRFADEARITGQLQHPAIPPVHDLGVLPDGRPFLAMKLIKGDTLGAELDARPDPAHDRGRFVAAFEQVCQAVAYAHAHNVIHRDLKPANIMVGSFGEVQVMDWGLAKVLGARADETDADATTGGTEIRSLRDSDGQATQAGAILGTPAFMPPEQAVGAVSKIDARSDVFGLGAILAVVLTGKPPYSGVDAETTRVLAARGKVETCFARLDASGADPGLVALCKRCLSPEPEDRPANAEEVARAVAALRAESEERARLAELDRVRVEGEKAAAELKAVEQRKRRRVLAGAAVVIMIGLAAFAEVQRRNSNRLAVEEKQTREAKELAEARLGQITDTWYNQVIFVQNELDQQAVSPAFRLGLLRTARDRLGEVLRDQPRTANTDHMLHVVYRRLGDTYRETGDMAGAMANWAEADRIARTRFAEEPTDTHAWRDVADAEITLGDIRIDQGDNVAALALFQEAERRLDALIAASPKSRAETKLKRTGRRSAVGLERFCSVRANRPRAARRSSPASTSGGGSRRNDRPIPKRRSSSPGCCRPRPKRPVRPATTRPRRRSSWKRNSWPKDSYAAMRRTNGSRRTCSPSCSNWETWRSRASSPTRPANGSRGRSNCGWITLTARM